MNWNSTTDGRVIWITGLSGAGKSTLAHVTAECLRENGERPVLIDGDDIRVAVADPHTGHDPASRLANAYRISRLAKLFAEQDHTVIVATMSLFHEIHIWNRANLPGYFEVWIEVDMATLQSRDARGLYSRAANQIAPDVAGIDLAYEKPKAPHWVIHNNADQDGLTTQAERILNQLNPELIKL